MGRNVEYDPPWVQSVLFDTRGRTVLFETHPWPLEQVEGASGSRKAIGTILDRFMTDRNTHKPGHSTTSRNISWNFIGSGVIFTCSGLFQAMGNTWPALLSGVSRLVIFAVPALWLSRQPGFTLRQVWVVSVVTVILQAILSFVLVRWEMRRKLAFAAVLPANPAVPAI